MSMLSNAGKTLGISLLVLFATLILVELTYRVKLFGLAGLSYSRMNSLTHIWVSGMVQTAENPQVYYELRPELDALFRGAAFSTNSVGLADQEYSVDKPPDTFRAVVLGSSLTMPSGVAIENAWHSVVEDALNERSTTRRFEFINFGVEHYGLGEIVATLRHKAVRYDPDLVVLALTSYTAWVLWNDDRPAFEVPPRAFRFFEFTALHHLSRVYDLGLYRAKKDRRETVTGPEEYLAQLSRALREMNQIADDRGSSFVVVWMGFVRPTLTTQNRLTHAARTHGFTVINASRPLFNSPLSKLELQVGVGDPHPNAVAHELMAEEIQAGLSLRSLLPAN
jgi:hypothetical protein